MRYYSMQAKLQAMTLNATIYDFSFQRLLNSFKTRLEYYVRLENGETIVLGEIGSIDHLCKKFEVEKCKDDQCDSGFKTRSCELIQDKQGLRFGRFTDC